LDLEITSAFGIKPLHPLAWRIRSLPFFPILIQGCEVWYSHMSYIMLSGLDCPVVSCLLPLKSKLLHNVSEASVTIFKMNNFS
jgi:hypothetical protein